MTEQSTTIEMRIMKDKDALIEQLKKIPIIQIACEKTGIGRATYYRWRKDDQEFSIKADEAIEKGCLIVNDMAESQLISAIKDKNLGAIIFWLRSHHPTYTNKVEVTGQLKHEYTLTEKEEELIVKALKMVTQGGEKSRQISG